MKIKVSNGKFVVSLLYKFGFYDHLIQPHTEHLIHNSKKDWDYIEAIGFDISEDILTGAENICNNYGIVNSPLIADIGLFLHISKIVFDITVKYDIPKLKREMQNFSEDLERIEQIVNEIELKKNPHKKSLWIKSIDNKIEFKSQAFTEQLIQSLKEILKQKDIVNSNLRAIKQLSEVIKPNTDKRDNILNHYRRNLCKLLIAYLKKKQLLGLTSVTKKITDASVAFIGELLAKISFEIAEFEFVNDNALQHKYENSYKIYLQKKVRYYLSSRRKSSKTT